VWIQKDEFRYYTGDAWQPGGDHGGIDPDDVQQLVRLNTEGRLRLVDGDNVEIFPGIRAYTGARHTFASQYLRVDGNPPFVLASDSVYLYRNLAEHKPSATFSEADYPANIRNQERMIQLAGSADRVVPGHDALQFQKFHTQGRVAKIKWVRLFSATENRNVIKRLGERGARRRVHNMVGNELRVCYLNPWRNTSPWNRTATWRFLRSISRPGESWSA
jgi:hypothetical protein